VIVAGNALACAAGMAVLETFEKEKILDNVNARSEQLFSALKEVQQSELTGHMIRDIRGAGLMVG
jgi:4-aminobutyrate aminotransferase